MRRALPLVAAFVGVLGFSLAGCEQADPTTAAYWIAKLKSPDRAAAIDKLAAMKAKAGVKPLMEAYKDGRNKYKIIAALTQIGDKEAVPTLLAALQDTSAAKAGQLAGQTLLEWGAKDHSDIYVNVASNKTAPNELRYGALKLLAEFPVPKAEQPLLSILNGDPDLQPIAFNGLAATALGKLQSAKAVPGMINCLWLDDHLHRNEVPACRLALNRVGPAAAVPELIKTLKRENRQVEKRARKFKFHIGGLVEAKAAELLGDMPHPDAVEPLIAALQKQEKMPVSVQNDPKKAQAFVMGGVQRVISVANALAVIGDERGVEPLLTVAGHPELALEHKLASTQQLAFLGSTKAIGGAKKLPGLMDLLEGKISQYDPVSQGFRVQLALAIGNLLDGDDEKTMARFEKNLDAIQEEIGGWIKATTELYAKEKKKGQAAELRAYNEWNRNYVEARAKLAAVRECKHDPACWGNKLGDKNVAVRLAAAYQLAQLSSARDTALAQLVKYVGEPDLVVRNVVLFGLDRLGDASIIPKLEVARAADAEKAKKDKRLRGAVYTLDLLMAKLSHKKKG